MWQVEVSECRYCARDAIHGVNSRGCITWNACAGCILSVPQHVLLHEGHAWEHPTHGQAFCQLKVNWSHVALHTDEVTFRA